jgi:hypothetical protein
MELEQYPTDTPDCREDIERVHAVMADPSIKLCTDLRAKGKEIVAGLPRATDVMTDAPARPPTRRARRSDLPGEGLVRR